MAHTREFEFLKSTLPPFIQLTAATVAAAWLAPQPLPIGAASGVVCLLLIGLGRMYLLIREEV